MHEDLENYMDETIEPPDCETEDHGAETARSAADPPIVPVGPPKKPKPKPTKP